MAQSTAEISNKVTVLVFKDNYSARTFQISLKWISRLGFFLGTLLLLGLISIGIAVQYYRLASKTDLSRVQDLEQEIADLRIAAQENKETKAVEAHPVPTPSNVSVESTPIATSATAFAAFAPAHQSKLPDAATLKFSMETPQLSWRGKNLRVKFALSYTKEDQGNQEGRILIVGRGPETLVTYPAGTLSRVGKDFLFLPEKGEFFSVSRYREVKANLGPFHQADSIQDVEIFIFDTQGQILTYQLLSPSPARKTPRPAEANENSEGNSEESSGGTTE